MNKATLLALFQELPIFGQHANEILPNQLWLGDINAALNLRWLQSTGITHIVSVISFKEEDVARYKSHFKYLTVFAHDNVDQQLLPHWPRTTLFIQDALEAGGKVLVHCKFGRSRSAATLAAFLVAGLNYSPMAAFSLIRERRPQVCPNTSFVYQLYYWAVEHERRRRLTALLMEPGPLRDASHK
jgi:serine/threonine/tyrosine-interacting protein